MIGPPPLSQIFDLSGLSEAGYEIALVASEEQRARLTEWAGLELITDFTAAIILKRTGAGRFSYEATLNTDIVQSCVVTLEPVASHLKLGVSRALHLVRPPPMASIYEQQLSPGADEGPEEIRDSHYDIVAPLLEEFSLAIDPYPRKPGAALEVEGGPLVRPGEGPFAMLKTLKKSP